MSPQTANVAFAIGILGLFVLDRELKSRTSPALWLPVAWLTLGASRTVSQWLLIRPLTETESPDAMALDRFVLTGLLAAGLLVLFARRRRTKTLLQANGPLLVFFLYCAVSILWSDDPVVAFKRWFRTVGSLVMVLVILTDPDPAAALKRLLARSAFLLVPLSVLFIKYYPHLGQGYSLVSGRQHNIGVAIGKNSLGIICLIFGLGSLWRFLIEFRSAERPRRTGPLIAHGAVLAMVLWLFVKADSATSLVCFLIGGGLITLTSRVGFALRPKTVHTFALLTQVLCVLGFSLNLDESLAVMLGRDPTLTGRTEIWARVLSIPVNPWFGAGIESFWLGQRDKLASEGLSFHLNQAHNGYIEVFLNLGLVGLVLLSIVIISGYRNLVRALYRDPQVGMLRLIFFAVVVVYNVTEATFKLTHPLWMIFLLTAMVIPEAPRETARDEASRGPRSITISKTQPQALSPGAQSTTPAR
jgi:exopolysaccharide production protein ExoQ